MNMKSLLAFALLFVHAIQAALTGVELQEVHGPYKAIRKVASSLAPSRNISSSDSPADILCVAKCYAQMNADMKRELPDFNPDSPYPFNYNPAKLDKMCQIHDTAKSCVDACLISWEQSNFKQWSSIIQFICQASTLKQNAQCLNDVAKNNTATCEADSKCGLRKKEVEQYEVTSPTNEAGLERYLKRICMYQKCMLDCRKPAVVQKCGQSAYNVLKGLFHKCKGSLQYFEHAMRLGGVIPAQCMPMICYENGHEEICD